MTIKEFEKHNKEKTMPREWIGQGWGYKAEWNPERPNDIIYIPEYGYEDTSLEEGEELEGELVPRENAFSVEDFIKICNGDEKKAERVFDNADWQFPYSILDEPWFECDDEEVQEEPERFLITEEQLREMVNFGIRNPGTEFYTEVMNDNKDFLSCTFFDKNDNNASGFWELDKEEEK